jgi:hypothetical protein
MTRIQVAMLRMLIKGFVLGIIVEYMIRVKVDWITMTLFCIFVLLILITFISNGKS